MSIASVFVGSVELLGRYRSAYLKHNTNTLEFKVSFDGIDGDSSGDQAHIRLRRDRAILQFNPDHYAFYQDKYPEVKTFIPGGFGENLSEDVEVEPDIRIESTMTESNVNIGSIYKLGTCLLEVSMPRFPCVKSDIRHGIKGLSKDMMKSARCGWFYRVLQEGTFKLGDTLILEFNNISTVMATYSIEQVIQILNSNRKSYTDDLIRLVNLPALSEEFKDRLKRKKYYKEYINQIIYNDK